MDETKSEATVDQEKDEKRERARDRESLACRLHNQESFLQTKPQKTDS